MSKRIPPGWKVYEFDGLWHFSPSVGLYPRPGVTHPEIYGSTHYHYDGSSHWDLSPTRNHARWRLRQHLRAIGKWGAAKCKLDVGVMRSRASWVGHF